LATSRKIWSKLARWFRSSLPSLVPCSSASRTSAQHGHRQPGSSRSRTTCETVRLQHAAEVYKTFSCGAAAYHRQLRRSEKRPIRHPPATLKPTYRIPGTPGLWLLHDDSSTRPLRSFCCIAVLRIDRQTRTPALLSVN
jgi:hypothetical protein